MRDGSLSVEISRPGHGRDTASNDTDPYGTAMEFSPPFSIDATACEEPVLAVLADLTSNTFALG
jgi:hypothetical protein